MSDNRTTRYGDIPIEQPRTIEDILALFLTACGDDDPHYYDEQIAEYADELRGMMGGDCNGNS